MDIDAYLHSPSMSDAGPLAAAAEAMGFDGVWVTETTHSPFTTLSLAARATDEIDVGSAIAVAFPRSPMVTAYTAWDLQALSGGRFSLGLGAQVKGHMQRRFSVDFEWERPGPRLRDYVEAVGHLWDAWASGGEVDYRGDFYEITLCPDNFRPSAIEPTRPDIGVAGVNPFNLKLAGHRCDVLHVHPMHSPAYLDEVVAPNVAEGAAIADRDSDAVDLSAQVFAITGDDREAARERVRQRIGFYGSTRTYRTIFDVHGWGDVSDTLHDLAGEGRWDELGEHVTDEMLEAFAVEAAFPDLRGVLEARYDHLDRVSLYTPFDGGDRWRHLINR